MSRLLQEKVERLGYESGRIVSTLNDLPRFNEPIEDWEAEYRAELIDELNEIEVALQEISIEQADEHYERMRYGDPSWD